MIAICPHCNTTFIYPDAEKGMIIFDKHLILCKDKKEKHEPRRNKY